MLHIITPFIRVENKNFYISNYRRKNIRWHPITTDTLLFKDDLMDNNWIQPYYPIHLESSVVGIIKINEFIKNFNIIDEDRYCFIFDDDWMEEDLPEKINKYEDDVIFVAMKRGQYIPENSPQHGISTLIPFPGVKPGHIGFQQIFVKGKVLKQMNFISDPNDIRHEMPDGHMAVWLQENFKVKYVNDIFSYFNYLQPGRWDKEEKEEKKVEIKKEKSKIRERFEKVRNEPRDISEHLGVLKLYGDQCSVIVELGVNEGVSTTAWALSLEENPKDRFVYCYDYIGPQEYLKPLLQICEAQNLNLKFDLANDLEIEIPECDLLFVDTLHTYTQMKKELELHANKAKKWIILHDTQTFAHIGVDGSEKGLRDALDEFLFVSGNKWFQKAHYPNCNGLTIIERR